MSVAYESWTLALLLPMRSCPIQKGEGRAEDGCALAGRIGIVTAGGDSFCNDVDDVESEAAAVTRRRESKASQLSSLSTTTVRGPPLFSLLAPNAQLRAADVAGVEAALAAPPRTSDHADGRGVGGGVARVPMPSTISHTMWVCSAREKSAAIAMALREKRAAVNELVLLVVGDGLAAADVLAEVEAHGVQGALTLEGLAERAAEARPLAAASLHHGRAHCLSADGGSSAIGLAAAAKGVRLLIAHESAIRGLHLGVQLVILTTLPQSVESYMHIAGRTGRVGKTGEALSILTESELARAGLLTRSLGVRWRTRRLGAG